MTPLALDIRAARTAAERILEELDLGSYVFTVEQQEGAWELSVQCAAGEAWQMVSFAVDPAKLRASLDDPAVRNELRAVWRTHLGPCARRGA
jgi:hypothetical protein